MFVPFDGLFFDPEIFDTADLGATLEPRSIWTGVRSQHAVWTAPQAGAGRWHSEPVTWTHWTPVNE